MKIIQSLELRQLRFLKFFFLLTIFASLLQSITIVRPQERVVVKRFGKIVDYPRPGLRFGLPWGIDQIQRIPIATVRRVSIGYQPEFDQDTSETYGQFLTGDQNLVNVLIAVDYIIGPEEKDVEQYILEIDRIEAILIREGENLVAEWIGGQSIDDVLLNGNIQLTNWLSTQLPKRLALYPLGIQISQTGVSYLAPPEEVRSAFEEVNRAQTGIRTQQYRALQNADQLLRSASADQFQFEQQAAAYADSKTSLAKAEAESFLHRLQSYQQLKSTNPNIHQLIWWEEMEQVFKNLKARGRIDWLDHYIGKDGLDITQLIETNSRK